MSNVAISNPAKTPTQNVLDRVARKAITKQLDSIKGGSLRLSDHFGKSEFGRSSDLDVSVQVHHSRFFRNAVMGGTLSVAESYMRGDWDCDDLTKLFRIFVRNQSKTRHLDRGFARVGRWGHRMFHWLNANTPTGSRRNIAAHYDLGNDFYRLWLDETLAYSSGIFKNASSTMEEASTEKFDRVCRCLELDATDEVLEIGTGWGGFALHAAEKYGCNVTSTTISAEQFGVARDRVLDAGLSQQVTLLQQDYRDLKGQYDKLVSIEMIEAVGHKYLDQYIGQCSRLLKSDGSLMFQAIVMPDHGYDRYRKSVDFIQRYIFPGGCLSSLGAILGSVSRTSDLRFIQAVDFAPHYAETLRRWRKSFQENTTKILQMGYSREFVRMWNYYLCYCEAAFEENYIGVMQIQFGKPGCRIDPSRPSRQDLPFVCDRNLSFTAPNREVRQRYQTTLH